MPTRLIVVVLALAFGGLARAAEEIELPRLAGSVKFAVIGDSGTGDRPQHDVAAQMAAARRPFPFAFVLMLGDNLYGGRDFIGKFERPYAELLQSGVPFYAALGNHDPAQSRSYPAFNMGGERYYTFVKEDVRFFVFDTNLMDRAQVAWIDDTLGRSRDAWKIAYFHHPIYSDGRRHGSNVELRVMLEPLLVRHGVNVVFSGHEHVYQRTVPQKGITYFVAGSGGKLRKGDVRPTALNAAAFDQDQAFMLVEIAGDRMFFQAISRTGRVVDSGVIHQAAEIADGRPR